MLGLNLSPDGRLLLSIDLYDKDDNLLAIIDHNEWIAGDPLPWDLEAGWRWLRIRQAKRNISLDVDARSELISIRAGLWFKGQRFDIRPGKTLFNGGTPDSPIVNAGVSELCFAGGYLFALTQPPSFGIAVDQRFKRMVMVSEADLETRIQKGLNAWNKLVREQTA